MKPPTTLAVCPPTDESHSPSAAAIIQFLLEGALKGSYSFACLLSQDEVLRRGTVVGEVLRSDMIIPTFTALCHRLDLAEALAAHFGFTWIRCPLDPDNKVLNGQIGQVATAFVDAYIVSLQAQQDEQQPAVAA